MGATRKSKNKTVENLLQSEQIQAAIDNGIDVQSLIDNLKRAPAERIRRHQIALNTVNMLRKAKFL